ncbi:MAG: hypothetical protein ACT4RN_23640 [Pseudonocardia sp.]
MSALVATTTARTGHDWRPADGWWLCGCAGSLPGHAEVTDPAGDDGCAMAWRECRRCAELDERPVTELHDEELHDEELHDIDLHDLTDNDEHRAGGFLRQDVPAGPALPNQHVSSEENAMVRRDEQAPDPERGPNGRFLDWRGEECDDATHRFYEARCGGYRGWWDWEKAAPAPCPLCADFSCTRDGFAGSCNGGGS